MSNKKKLKSRNGATRITPDKSTGGFCGLYKLQMYSKDTLSWSDIEGCTELTWTEAVTARKNYVALRAACKVANSGVIKLHVPNEGDGN
jgi:hypothetical protein|nr:MAG TPA: hypothetical protein [Caudoviricetes sp.]